METKTLFNHSVLQSFLMNVPESFQSILNGVYHIKNDASKIQLRSGVFTTDLANPLKYARCYGWILMINFNFYVVWTLEMKSIFQVKNQLL